MTALQNVQSCPEPAPSSTPPPAPSPAKCAGPTPPTCRASPPDCARRSGSGRQRGAEGRAKVLARFAVWLGEHRDEIETLLIKETGKSAADAAQEVPLLIMIASYYIKTMEKALAPETRPASLPFLAIKKITVHYRPRAGRRHHRAVELPGRQRPDGRHRRAGRGLRGAAQAVRAHAADRRTAAARLAGLGCAPRCSRWRRAPGRCPRPSSTTADYIQFTGSTARRARR